MNRDDAEVEKRIKSAKAEAERMFNLAEKVIMEYICYYLNIEASELFKEHNIVFNKPKSLILNPIKEYSDKYLEFSLAIVPYSYKLELPKILEENEEVNYTVGFIYHSITTVFNAILKSNINTDKLENMVTSSFHLELDDNNLAFYPVYMHPPRRMQSMLLQMKNELEPHCNKISELDSHLSNIIYDKDIADKDELDTNALLKQKDRIGIIFKEINL
jgi:hypothetical protein